MGLDMYLNAYLRPTSTKTSDGFDVWHIKINLGYWRKANAIHNWFVNNVQEGKDDCNEYEVTKEQLIALSDICLNILDKKSTAEDSLPTTSGFFFGSVEYDEYYRRDLENTIDICKKAVTKMESDPSIRVYYQSSW